MPDPAPATGRPGCYEIYGSKEAAMMTHTTVQALGQARPPCTTKPGAMRWSATLAAPGGSGSGQCAWARESRGE